MAVATQTFAEGYRALATAFTDRDAAALLGSMAAITTAKDMLIAAGTELQSA